MTRCPTCDSQPSSRCRRSARLIELAHDMFERGELDYATYRAVFTGAPAPCDNRACAVCFRQTPRPTLRSVQ